METHLFHSENTAGKAGGEITIDLKMKDELLQVKNYIDDISVKGTSENFEYDFCPFLQNILDALTAEQQDNFIGELLRCKDSCLYFIARFLDFTD